MLNSVYSVLYVEKDEYINKIVLKYLKKYFTTIYNTNNGKEALKIYRKKKPDIIITAIKIPKINGLELSYKIREENKKIPIIITTAYTTTEYLLKAVELHLIKYIIKPIKENILLKALQLCIKEIESESIIHLSNEYKYNIKNQILSLNDKIIPLRISHKLLLEILIKNSNRVVTYIELENYIWGYNRMSDAALRSLIYDIRAIMGKDVIYNISKTGYKIKLKSKNLIY